MEPKISLSLCIRKKGGVSKVGLPEMTETNNGYRDAPSAYSVSHTLYYKWICYDE